ncbi:hypothetical protein Tco_0619924 [Tanacetum coccineum]
MLTSFEESDLIWEEFEAYLARNDDLPIDIESDLREIEYFLNHDPIEEMDSILEDSVDKNSPDDNLVDTLSEMFTDEHALDYSSPPLWDDYDDELFDLETVDALSSTNNEDKVFNPGILIHENLFDVTNCETPEKNVKKTTNAYLILEDFNPPIYELPFHKEVLGLGALLSFSYKNEEKVFNPGILTSKRVHSSLLPELSHRGTKAFKVIKILESPMEIFPCSYREDIRILDVPDSDFLLKQFDAFLALEDDTTSPEVDHSYYDSEGDILLLEAFLNDDTSLPPPTQGMYLPQIRKELQFCEA